MKLIECRLYRHDRDLLSVRESGARMHCFLNPRSRHVLLFADDPAIHPIPEHEAQVKTPKMLPVP